MNISALFIRRPVLTTLIMAALAVFGWMAYRSLPVSDLPNVDFPTISVSASLPGASPETMASSVATPLEREFSTIAGIDSMSSTSVLGGTSITIQFNLSRDIDAAAQDVQAAIARTARRLPPEMPSPPSYSKVNPADQPVLYLAVTSPTLPLYTVNEFADTMIAQRISTLPGVAQVVVYGSQKFAVRIQTDPQRLAAMGLGIDEVAGAVQARNVNLPVGVINGPRQALTLESSGQLMDAGSYERAIISYRNGSPVRLDQVARVVNSVENDRTAAWYRLAGEEGQRGVILAVQRQPGTNTVAIVNAINRLLPAFREQVPPSITIATLYDRSVLIRHSVNDVKFTLVLTLGLVVMVIFLFLRNLRATIIPSLAMPLSIVGTFAAMLLLGFNLDNLSLMALTLSVGFVVDDAIVVLENIVRHMEMGKPPLQAAYDGSREIGFTVLSMTLSLIAVFIPVLFMGGVIGRLLNEFAVTIAIAILISGLVSLTLTPMLCGRFLSSRSVGEHARHGRLYNLTERGFNALIRAYGWTLRPALRFRSVTLVVSLAVLGGTVILFQKVPKGFLPSEDTGRIFAQTEAAEGTSFQQMARYQQALADIVAAYPETESFMSSIGARGASATGANVGTLFIKLRDKPERTKSVDQVIAELRARLAAVPGVRAYLQNPPTIRVGGQLTKSLYQYTLQGADTDEMYRVAPRLAEKMQAIPGLQDVTTDLQLKNPQLLIDIDRDRAAAVAVTPEQIELALSSAFGTRQISTIYAPNNSYQVIMEVDPAYQTDPSWLDTLYIRGGNAQLVQLSSVARFKPGIGPASVNHAGQLPAVTISFNLAPGTSLGPAVAAVNEVARQTLPATITTSFQGTAQVFQSSFAGLGMLLLMAILTMYLILGVLYESFIHPITILTALPFAAFGALLTLYLFHAELSLYAFVGVIMLIGLVKKNGIMMIDFAIGQRGQGATARDAIYNACLVRFRPIMMTTFAALMGTLPIALGVGVGAASRRPLGLAVVGGLIFSQLITLYATPVFYLYLDPVQRAWERWLARRDRAASHHEPAPTPRFGAPQPAATTGNGHGHRH